VSHLLVVDDDRNIRSSLQKLLTKAGHTVTTLASGEEALQQTGAAPDAVLMDIRMAGLSGLDTFRQLKDRWPRVPVIMMTAFGTTETAIEAMQLGAYEYLLKPFDVPALLKTVEHALATRRLTQAKVLLEAEQPDETAERIIGRSPAMFEVYKRIGQVGSTDVTVLIRGESGTGKELVARAIYQHSQRAQQPFIAVNCAAIPETLLESELFGHEKGAFTGAIARRLGKFEQAHGGTLFLDEIGDMSLPTQAKILRALQESRCERLGGHESVTFNVRILAATSQELEARIRAKQFREDLYYRLKVVTITLPPLRERRADIPLLADYFLRRFSREFGSAVKTLHPDALTVLQQSAWPGNVRELEHCLKQAVVLSHGEQLLPEHLHLEGDVLEPVVVARAGASETLADAVERTLRERPGMALQTMTEAVEQALIARALEQTQGNQSQAAKLLGITRATLRDKLERYHLQPHVSVSAPATVSNA